VVTALLCAEEEQEFTTDFSAHKGSKHKHLNPKLKPFFCSLPNPCFTLPQPATTPAAHPDRVPSA
jgi:hypothetical protein